MVRDFDNWVRAAVDVSSLEELRGTRVGIEAADYVNTRIIRNPRVKEPLVPALGGLPLAMKVHIEEDLHRFAAFGIEPFFVFSGLDLARPEDPFRERQIGAAVNTAAWALYDIHEAEQSVLKFGESSEPSSPVRGRHGS